MEKLYCDHRIEMFDGNGEIIDTVRMEDSGSITIEDMQKDLHVDQIRVTVTKAEIRDGDDVLHRFEVEDA